MTKRIAALALLAGLLAVQAGGHAQEPTTKTTPARPAPDNDPPPTRRTVYPLRHADPAALASILGRHYKGRAEVSALPPGSGDGLLISASPVVTDEVVKLLGQLDRQPRSVVVGVVLAEIAAKAREDGKAPALPELTGTGAEVLTRLEELAKSGQVTLQRVTLTAVEGHPVSVTTGGSKPVTTGAAGGPAARAQRSVTYHPVGTTVKATSRIGAGDVVAVELSVQDTKVRPPEPADEGGAAAIDTATLATRVSVPAGKAVTAQALRTDGKAGRSVTVVIVTADVIDAGPKASN